MEQFLNQIDQLATIPGKYREIVKQFYVNYKESLRTHALPLNHVDDLFSTLLQLIKKQLQEPFKFELFHKQLRKPFDYYRFGLDFTLPLINMAASKVLGIDLLHQITSQIAQGDNVVFLANHQTELDPLIIGCLLEETHAKLATEMIFVAGGRVTSDPLAAPFSMGCNLLCIYSKKYIDHPPELKTEKQLHNQRTMKLMSQLLSEGGKCIYVAPSGGRDRCNAQSVVEVAPFDPGSIEMFRLMSLQSAATTHFYPMALSTYHLLPPPQSIQKELGEVRLTSYTPVGMAIGSELSLTLNEESSNQDKKVRRQLVADSIWQQVCADYAKLQELL